MDRYEVRMLERIAKALTPPPAETLLKNALLEAFLMHARNLYDFFSKRPTSDDDVRACHYLATWDHKRASTNPVLQEYFGRGKPANTKAFHLSIKRLSEPKTDWPVVEIEAAMLGVWKEFLQQWADRSRPR